MVSSMPGSYEQLKMSKTLDCQGEQGLKIIDIRKYSGNVVAEADNDDYPFGDLGKRILEGLRKPNGQKSIPSLILWDKKGLEIFKNELEFVKEYYVVSEEIQILEKYGEEMADKISNGSIVVEFGSGSLQKTRILLNALDKKCSNIQYYALDLVKTELQETLHQLPKYANVTTTGLWGTYDDGREYMKTLLPSIAKTILWFGSTMGNFTRPEAAKFLNSFNPCFNSGDAWIIGIDRPKDGNEIFLAYDDPAGVQRRFCLNGLNNASNILGQPGLLDMTTFEYSTGYNSKKRRLESFYKSKVKQDLIYNEKDGMRKVVIQLEENERVHFAYAHKYSTEDSSRLFQKANLSHVVTWTSSEDRYDFHMAKKP